jgi:hypothetical protein
LFLFSIDSAYEDEKAFRKVEGVRYVHHHHDKSFSRLALRSSNFPIEKAVKNRLVLSQKGSQPRLPTLREQMNDPYHFCFDCKIDKRNGQFLSSDLELYVIHDVWFAAISSHNATYCSTLHGDDG